MYVVIDKAFCQFVLCLNVIALMFKVSKIWGVNKILNKMKRFTPINAFSSLSMSEFFRP